MPFIHIFATYLSFNKTEILGFPTLGSFFYSAGWPLMLVCYGFVVRKLKRFALPEAQKSFNGFVVLLISVGVYFFMYAIIPMPPKKDLPTWSYFTLIGFASAVIGNILYRLPDNAYKFKEIIRNLMEVIVNKVPEKGLLKDKYKYDEEIIFPTIEMLDEKTR